jgi:endonuclease-8
VVLGVEGWEAVCFSAPTVRTFVDRAGYRTPVDHLGPDLCERDADLDAAVERMARIPTPGTTVAEVLLDQRVAAGIGNVHKSEALWACRVDPFTPIEDVDVETRRALVETAHRHLVKSLAGPARETVPGGLAAYGRTRRPCPRCGTPIRSRRHGEQMRSTYWCPTCQSG